MTVAENIEFGAADPAGRTAPNGRGGARSCSSSSASPASACRCAHQLSGGQLQRVAARAGARVAIRPSSCWTSPSARSTSRSAPSCAGPCKEIQRRLGVTTILVTHDQEEAFELGRPDRRRRPRASRRDRSGRGDLLAPEIALRGTFLGAGTVLIGRCEEGSARFGEHSFPLPATSPHEEGSRLRVLIRPEQVRLGGAADGAGAVDLGEGEVVERTFAAAMRRVRVRLPLPAATRQIAPAPPDAASLLVEASEIASEPPATGKVRVSIAGWHLLDPAPPAILVCDTGRGGRHHLAVARDIAERLEAVPTVLAIAPDAEEADRVGRALRRRLAREGLAYADVRLRYGDIASQIEAEQAESLYELVVVGDRSSLARRLGLSRGPKSLGPTLRALVVRSLAPLLVVDGEPPDFRRLLLCTAAGAPSARDARFVARLARRLATGVTLLHVRTSSADAGAENADRLAEAREALAAAGVEARVRVRVAADIASGILEEAAAGGHGLIAVGQRARGVESVLPDDGVLLRLFERADRPVLMVPAEKV